MKKYIRNTITAALLVGLSAAPSHADDEALAAFGGFVVGMITGAIIENNTDHHYDGGIQVSYEHHGDYRNGHRCGKHNRHGCRACHKVRHSPKGYWETKRYKVWVPGHWAISVNDCGDRYRVWKSGHYTYQTKRVWIARNHRNSSRYRCG